VVEIKLVIANHVKGRETLLINAQDKDEKLVMNCAATLSHVTPVDILDT